MYACKFTKVRMVEVRAVSICCTMFIELPEPPKITGNPTRPVSPGSSVSLVCQSKGKSPDTRLVWYRDGRQIDINYAVFGNYVRNEYVFTAKTGSPTTLECRLEYRPADLVLSDTVVVAVQGNCLLTQTNNLPQGACRTYAKFVCYCNIFQLLHYKIFHFKELIR